MIATPLLTLTNLFIEQILSPLSWWACVIFGLAALAGLLLGQYASRRRNRHNTPGSKGPASGKLPEAAPPKPPLSANLSPAFRTPLALILESLEGKAAEAKRNPEGKFQFTGREVNAMHQNATRLLQLIKQGPQLPAPGAGPQLTVKAPGERSVLPAVAAAPVFAAPQPSAPAKETAPARPAGEAEPLLLIVEDNEEVRRYLCDSFAGQYQVIEAEHGLEGLRKAVEAVPDLVISDLMMPKMDGLELCRHLKTDERTSHIPVIMLTARASVESKLDGLETGADDYVTKPFHPQELQARVRNLIDGRRTLRARFGREVKLQPKDITVSSADEKFLQNAIAVVEKHMSDSGFSVEVLENEMMMSKMQLYRKLKALTDQSPSEFVRTLRLKRAASLISQRSGNISEIAYDVGFNNLSYFAKCFKEQYGVPPSEYASRTEALV
jgi:DNA-binding response OmpR family regulator